MELTPLHAVGAGLALVGALLFASQLFGHGGFRNSQQFRVMSELFAGTHGSGAKRLSTAGVVCLVLGSGLLFAQVIVSDGARAERCRQHCSAAGYESAAIGPNSDRTKDRATWFVACICESPSKPPSESRAE